MNDDFNTNEHFQQFFIGLLLSKIESEDYEQKTLAACGLCLSQDPRALPALKKEAFQHPYLYRYVAAAAPNVAYDDPAPAVACVERLMEGFASSDFWIQWLAISGLSQSRDRRAIAALKQELVNGSGYFKMVAAALADKLDPEDLPDIIRAVQNPDLCAETAMGIRIVLPPSGLGPALIPVLKALLCDTAYPRKDLVLEILGDADREAGLEAMTSLASHSDDKIRGTIAWLLHYYAVDQIFHLLLSLLHDVSWRVRAWAACSMGSWGEEGGDRVFDLLLPLLEDPSRRVRVHAALSLALVGREKALPYLQRLEAERKLLGRPLKVARQFATQ